MGSVYETWELYTQETGLYGTTGVSLQDFSGGAIQVEVWSPTGEARVILGLGGDQASRIVIPYE